MDQQYLVALCLGSEEQDIFYSVGVAPGKDMVSFVVDRARMETVDVVTVRLWAQNKWDDALIAELRSSDYTLPQAPASGDVKEVLTNGRIQLVCDV